MDSRTLKLASYNCRGLPKTRRLLDNTRPNLTALLDGSDIVCLQETWFSEQSLANLNSLVPEFYGTGVSTTNLEDGIVHGHPPGGVAILFRSNLAEHIKPLVLGLDWCAGIEVSFGGKVAILLSIYLPHQCPSNEDEYVEKLAVLRSVVEEFETSCFAHGVLEGRFR